MKFSLFYPVASYQEHATLSSIYEDTIQVSTFAEELGFECIYFNEGHDFSSNYKNPNARILISAVAQHTSSINLGVAITGLAIKDPRFLAEDVVMLDSICNGRLMFGHSIGYVKNYQEFGIDQNLAQEVYDVKVQAFDAFLDGKTVNSELDFLRYKSACIANKPEFSSLKQRIFHGTTSAGKVRAIGAKGNRLGFTMKTLPSVGKLSENRSLSEISKVINEYNIGWQSSEIYPLCAPPITLNLMAHVFDNKKNHCDLVNDCLNRYWTALTGMEQNGNTHMSRCFDDGVTPFGSAEDIVGRLNKLNALGIDSVMLCFNFGGMPKDLVRSNIKRFAEEIMPFFCDEPNLYNEKKTTNLQKNGARSYA